MLGGWLGGVGWLGGSARSSMATHGGRHEANEKVTAKKVERRRVISGSMARDVNIGYKNEEGDVGHDSQVKTH